MPGYVCVAELVHGEIPALIPIASSQKGGIDKGIASGMPLAAVVARAETMEAWTKGAQGSTYGGNPVACAAALATIGLLQDGLIDNAAARGEQGLAALRELAADHPDTVVDTRGLGLMLALELATPEQALALEHAAFERGLLVLGCGHKSVRLSPPLIIDEATMARLGIDPQELARKLAWAVMLSGQKEHYCKTFTHGRFTISSAYYRMMEWCPLCTGAGGNGELVVIDNVTGEELYFPSMMPHLVYVHHFFESPRSSYRVEPEEAARVLSEFVVPEEFVYPEEDRK